MTEPWSNWPEPTVEADPSSLVGVLLARTEARDDARMWAMALENRLAEVRRVVGQSKACGLLNCTDVRCNVLRVIDAELVAE